jgi:hypothetical protein
MFSESLEAIFKLGVPMLVLSGLVYAWLYREGKIEIQDNKKTRDASLKILKKNRKSEKKEHQNFFLDKWLWMGGGFYGLAALWTLMVVEVLDFVRLIINFSDFIALLNQGPGAVISSIITNQIANLLSAFLWFGYWADGLSLVWIAIAYIGYLLGIQVARRSQGVEAS